MKLEINNPCHENWDAMTPNEKGAFCLSCQKNVIDFSKQTIDEIKNFFSELPKTEKVCGRFKESQLNFLSFEHFFDQFKTWKLTQKAALVVFFTCGFSLFGFGQDKPGNKHPVLKGEIEIVKVDTGRTKIKSTIKKPVEDPTILGGPRFIPDNTPKTPEPKHKEIMGKPAVIRDPK